MSERASLTTKQRRFVEEYLVDFNGAQAAKRAKYKGNDATLRVVASENLSKPNVKAAIERRLQALCMSTDEALMRLAEMARVGYTKYIGPDGTVDLGRMKEDGMMHLVKGVRWVRGQMVVEFNDPQRAMDMILKAGGAYKDKGDAPVVNVNFDLEEWKEKRRSRLDAAEQLDEPQNG